MFWPTYLICHSRNIVNLPISISILMFYTSLKTIKLLVELYQYQEVIPHLLYLQADYYKMEITWIIHLVFIKPWIILNVSYFFIYLSIFIRNVNFESSVVLDDFIWKRSNSIIIKYCSVISDWFIMVYNSCWM